jgi:hypothetical protein
MRRNRMLALVVPFALLAAALPDGPPAAAAQKSDWYAKAVKKVEAKFEPAEAKPGQTVTFKLTVDLNEGYHTYPTVQPDKMAASMVNVLKFPGPGAVVFVGAVADPKDFETKAEPELGIKELRENGGTVVFTRKAVVSPKAAPGPTAVKLDSFKLLVCDKTNCFPSKAVAVEAALKVLDGPAVPVEKDYADEVAKALAGK